MEYKIKLSFVLFLFVICKITIVESQKQVTRFTSANIKINNNDDDVKKNKCQPATYITDLSKWDECIKENDLNNNIKQAFKKITPNNKGNFWMKITIFIISLINLILMLLSIFFILRYFSIKQKTPTLTNYDL